SFSPTYKNRQTAVSKDFSKMMYFPDTAISLSVRHEQAPAFSSCPVGEIQLLAQSLLCRRADCIIVYHTPLPGECRPIFRVQTLLFTPTVTIQRSSTYWLWCCRRSSLHHSLAQLANLL